MTKVLACADLHLGAGTDYGRTPMDRLADQRRSWIRACEVAIEQKVEQVLFAGDAFHRPRPTPAELLAFRDGLDLLRDAGISFLAIPGNHDIAAATPGAPHALTLFDNKGGLPRGVGIRGGVVIDAPRVFHCRGGLEVACLPWTPLGGYLTHRDGDRDKARQDAAEALTEVAAGLRGECTTDHPLLLVHWAVTGAQTVSGVGTELFREVVLNAGALEALGWGEVIAGHIHKTQRFPGGFYCGSLTTVDFGEADALHAVFVRDLDASPSPDWDVIPIADRRFVTIDGWQNVADADVADAIVRVRYEATADEIAKVNHTHLRKLLLDHGAHSVWDIHPTVIRGDRARVQVVATVTPVDGLNTWIDHQQPPVKPAPAARMRSRIERYLDRL